MKVTVTFYLIILIDFLTTTSLDLAILKNKIRVN